VPFCFLAGEARRAGRGPPLLPVRVAGGRWSRLERGGGGAYKDLLTLGLKKGVIAGEEATGMVTSPSGCRSEMFLYGETRYLRGSGR
jgi:hypothetical protein